MGSFLPLSTIVCAVLTLFVLKRWLSSRNKLPYPPGPYSKPLIGNVLQILSEGPWHFYMRCKQKYGDLVFFQGLGNRILVVNSLASINELFEKRWNIYSDRPKFTAVGELMGNDQSLALMKYGEEWRDARKMLHAVLNPAASKRWHSIQEDFAALLLRDLLAEPDGFYTHIRLAAARVILHIGYGLFPKDIEDPYFLDNERSMDVVGAALTPGAFLCDMLPILKYSPSWVPFQRRITEAKEYIYRAVVLPYRDIQKRVENGTAAPSLANDLITSGEYEEPTRELRAIWAIATMYGAGTETTFASVATFVLAMVLHPEVQTRAQVEIDRVVGERMPNMADVAELPYVRAIVKETLRWRPPLPLSLPRCAVTDDVYQGYFIPKGTILLPNVWAISRDTSNPETFNPDRFLDPSKQNEIADPFDYVFGFGRRVCSGIYVAENSMSILMLSILWAFNISQEPGYAPEPEFVEKSISYPKKFPCKIVPRSAARIEILRQRVADVKIGEA